jgi:hypothetical protein
MALAAFLHADGEHAVRRPILMAGVVRVQQAQSGVSLVDCLEACFVSIPGMAIMALGF